VDDSLRPLILQTVMRGFRGVRVGADDAVMADVKQGLGSVVLFDVDGPSGGTMARNVESSAQMAELCAHLHQAVPDLPLLIAIDMEGGLVCRLHKRHGFPATICAQDLGATGDPQQTYDAAAGIADTLATAGINLNQAPCVDVNMNPDNPIIGSKKRSYGRRRACGCLHRRSPRPWDPDVPQTLPRTWIIP